MEKGLGASETIVKYCSPEIKKKLNYMLLHLHTLRLMSVVLLSGSILE
jgi:hypothetical protein